MAELLLFSIMSQFFASPGVLRQHAHAWLPVGITYGTQMIYATYVP